MKHLLHIIFLFLLSCTSEEITPEQTKPSIPARAAAELEPFTYFEGTWNFDHVLYQGTQYSDTTATAFAFFEFRDFNPVEYTVRFHDRGYQGGTAPQLLAIFDEHYDPNGDYTFSLRSINPQTAGLRLFTFRIIAEESTSERVVILMTDSAFGSYLRQMKDRPFLVRTILVNS